MMLIELNAYENDGQTEEIDCSAEQTFQLRNTHTYLCECSLTQIAQRNGSQQSEDSLL